MDDPFSGHCKELVRRIESRRADTNLSDPSSIE